MKRKHWIIYYHERKSLISDNMLLDEVRRDTIPHGMLGAELPVMQAFARKNAKPSETHFTIGRASEPRARRADQMLMEITPCR